jgi:hypothetical protein
VPLSVSEFQQTGGRSKAPGEMDLARYFHKAACGVGVHSNRILIHGFDDGVGQTFFSKVFEGMLN